MTRSGLDHGSLEPMLATWLPGQRWFAGSHDDVRSVRVTSDVELADGDPELRHLVVDVDLSTDTVRYQVLLAIRGLIPPELAGSVVGILPDGRTAYDGALDPEMAGVLLRGFATGRTAGPLRFAVEPGAIIDLAAQARTLPALASNTNVVFGDKAILKLIRRPAPGRHPDLEVPSALARGGSRLVAAPLGWIELRGPEPTVLAIMSEYFTDASDGWSLATASLDADRPDFSTPARLLGQATAQLHSELAAAFGTSALSGDQLAETTGVMAAELAQAVEVVPQLREYEAGVLACYAELAKPHSQVVVQRIHGDYHLAQVLRTDGGWVVLDFEGEPSVPLTRRRAFASPLRDVAGMLRSFDYAGRYQAMQRPADSGLASVAHEWISRCQGEFLAGYAGAAGADASQDGTLLRALTYAKAVYEAVYEARHRPSWLPIPLAALAEATQ